MKTFYSILMAMVAAVLFAPLAVADPGTTWDKQINRQSRFKVLSEFNGAAVLDQETGRVWEQSPDLTARDWLNAQIHCNRKTVGNRKGWRLPTVQELASLVDPGNVSPALPIGHPFTLTSAQEDGIYWSATTFAFDTSSAWDVNLFSGSVVNGSKSFNDFVWCVRGGQGVDPQ